MTQNPPVPAGLFLHEDDGVLRCQWCRASPEYRRYHDEEWGFPVTDDAGCSRCSASRASRPACRWLTILDKRETFRRASRTSTPRSGALRRQRIARLLADAGIVRHRGKIVSTINNAQRVLELRQEFGSLAAYAWGFEPQADTRPHVPQTGVVLGPSAEAVAMSKDLKKRG